MLPILKEHSYVVLSTVVLSTISSFEIVLSLCHSSSESTPYLRSRSTLNNSQRHPIDSLLQIVDAALASATARAGSHLACRPGCSQCCHGIFAISQQDAARLREGLALLVRVDPARAARIQTRAAAARVLLQHIFPGDPQTGRLDGDYEGSPLFNDLADEEPCPVLDPTTGTCDLYQHRPVLCRTFGPPMRTPENDLATCELCFIQATTAEIAAAELDPSIPTLQAESDLAFDQANNTHGETVIAFALLPWHP